MTRALSEQELEEIENLAAECDLKPERRRVYFAELIRLREFARCAGRFRNRLPLKVQQSLERNVPRGADLPLLVEEAIEEKTEAELHKGLETGD
jgi:hypothetical protein